jgi:pyruvate dehydrogenase E2 component (dihydrolipoamide acetyltransferase)
MLESIEAPRFGDTDGEAILSSWMVNVGDVVKIGDVIASVETNKALIEVEASKAGVIFELKVNVGDVLLDNQVIVTITTSGIDD